MTRKKSSHSGNGSNKKRIRNDVILIISLSLALALVFVIMTAFAQTGSTVTVTVDGKPYAQYPLNADISVNITTGEGGENVNRLIIKDGKAYVESADCPDGICASHRPIHLTGESIVCLPHRVVIRISGSGADAPDLIV